MSNSVLPQRRQLTRLPHPWDSPDKNTGVGCHFLLRCMKVKSESEVAYSCPTFSNPMDCSPPGSSIHGMCQARVLERGAIAFSEPGQRRMKIMLYDFPGGLAGKELAYECKRCKRCEFHLWVRKIPWRRKWQLTPVFSPGESHGHRALWVIV